MGAYESLARLTSHINDADRVASALRSDGFSVTVAHDLGRDDLIKGRIGQGRGCRGEGWGHGEGSQIPVRATSRPNKAALPQR
jgi:hypothetical protein